MGLYVGNTKYKPIVGGVGYKVVKLPYDAEIEYLQSTGTQWINTNKFPYEIGRWELTILFTELNTLKAQVNGSFASPNRRFDIGAAANGRFITNIGTTKEIARFDTNKHIFVLDNIDGYVKMDANQVSISRVTFEQQSRYPILIANRIYYQDGYNYVCKERIYSSRLYDYSNRICLDYIPVRVGTTGYLYDKVSGQLFGNAGTGNFILGNDKN